MAEELRTAMTKEFQFDGKFDNTTYAESQNAIALLT